MGVSLVLLSLLGGLSIDVVGAKDHCDFVVSIPKAIQRWQKEERIHDAYHLSVTPLQTEISIEVTNEAGIALLRRKLPYDAQACAPAVDRIAVVIDSFFTDFTRCGNEEEGETQLPIKKFETQRDSTKIEASKDDTVAQTSTAKEVSTLGNTSPLPSRVSSATPQSAASNTLSFGLFGTAASDLNPLAIHLGGQAKLTFSYDSIRFIGGIGAAGALHQEFTGPSDGSKEELSAQPLNVQIGAGKCFHLDRSEMCLLIFGGQEYFFGTFTDAASGETRKQTLDQWLFEGGLEYGYEIARNLHVHVGGNLGYRPGDVAFSTSKSTDPLQIGGWTVGVYTGLGFDLFRL
jgi:hypothetical protein